MMDVFQGSIWKKSLKFAIPMILGAFFQHLYVVVDTIIIGKYIGEAALSSIGGSASKIIILFTNFFIGISVGITSFAAQYFGEKNFFSLQKIIVNGIVFFGISALIVGFLSIILIEDVLKLINTPHINLAKDYLNIYFIGLIFCVFYNLFTGILRAIGESNVPFYVLIFSSFMNIALNFLFFFVFSWGIKGIALATVISQAFSVIILFSIISYYVGSFKTWFWKYDFHTIREIFKVGIPAGLQSIMYSLSNILNQSIINTFDSLSIIAWVTYLRIDSILDIVISSLSSTTLTFVGQNYGAKNYNRVKQSIIEIMKMCAIIIVLIIAIISFFKEPILYLFTNNETVVIKASKIMFIVLPMYFLSVPQWIYTQSLRAIGDTFIPMILSLVGVVMFRVFWGLIIVPLWPNIFMLGLGYPINAFLLSSMFFIYFQRKMKFILNTY